MLRVVGGSKKSEAVLVAPKPLYAWKVDVSGNGAHKPDWVSGFVTHGCLQIVSDPCRVASPGDWIVRDSFGALHVLSEGMFRENFTVIEE